MEQSPCSIIQVIPSYLFYMYSATRLYTFVLSFMVESANGVSWQLVVRFAFLGWLAKLSIFSCSCWPSVVYLLWRVSQERSFSHFKIRLFLSLLLLSWQRVLCATLTANPLSATWLANVFCHSVGQPFYLCFLRTNIFMMSNWPIFFFCCLCF